MVAVGILGKEFIRWSRDGKNTHIFNPSALSLFVFSVALIITETTSWSFAEEIATTLNNAPHIYLEIFLLGLVVQYFFRDHGHVDVGARAGLSEPGLHSNNRHIFLR